MKKVLYITGAVLVVGAVATMYYSRKKKKNKVSEKDYKYEYCNDIIAEEKNKPSTEAIIAQDESDYEDVKSSAIESMLSRHEDVTNIISDSVDAIRENIKEYESTNDEIDDISSELDRMISED